MQSTGRVFAYVALTIASHGLLDALASYGQGIELLAPFSQQRYASPWQPIDGPLPEILWLWLPALLFLGLNSRSLRPSAAAAWFRRISRQEDS